MSQPPPLPGAKPRGHACVGNLILGVTALAAVVVGLLVYFPAVRSFEWLDRLFPLPPAPMAEPFPTDAPALSCSAPVPGGQPVVDRTKPFVNGLGMEFVPVPWEGGARLFSRWETRVQDYAAYAKASRGVDPSWQDTGFAQGPTHPVVRVDWQDARNFCAWLTEAERRAGRLDAGWEYRLPTDAEWSAAAGLTAESDQGLEAFFGNQPPRREPPWLWGWRSPPPRGAGNYYADSPGRRRADRWGWTNPHAGRTAPAGSFVPNGFGLYDLGGNAAEWVDEARPFPKEPIQRVLRGESWSSARPPRSNYRDLAPVGLRNTYNGFRTVIAPVRADGR